jgi:H/ACA ribonucleoprotein complex non-core subunit NAF1
MKASKCISSIHKLLRYDQILSSDSDSSDVSGSESNSELEAKRRYSKHANSHNYLADGYLDHEEDDGEEGTAKVQGYVKTQHEVIEANVAIPSITEIAADEPLEKVGEVMAVLPETVVVRGIPAPVLGRASEKALDSETLLVLEDRKVLGYVRYPDAFGFHVINNLTGL